MQGQEKLTLFVILLFFTISLCLTLLSVNEKVYDFPDEQIVIVDNHHIIDNFLPIKFCKFAFQTILNSVQTILTMPFVLRRLTLAECCSWLVSLSKQNMISLFFFYAIVSIGQLS